jgi:acetyl esterase/lipase
MKLPALLLLAACSLHAEEYDKSVPKPTHAEVRYGPHERNVLDFWQAASDTPAPLVLVVHGGGWKGGRQGAGAPLR